MYRRIKTASLTVTLTADRQPNLFTSRFYPNLRSYFTKPRRVVNRFFPGLSSPLTY